MGTETPVRHRILSRGGHGPRKLLHSSVMVGGCWAAADGLTCFLLGFWSEATAHVAAVHAETHSLPAPPPPPLSPQLLSFTRCCDNGKVDWALGETHPSLLQVSGVSLWGTLKHPARLTVYELEPFAGSSPSPLTSSVKDPPFKGFLMVTPAGLPLCYCDTFENVHFHLAQPFILCVCCRLPSAFQSSMWILFNSLRDDISGLI